MTSWFFACFPLVSKWYQLDLHPIDQRSSSRVQLEAWLTSLLQTVKIFLLNRITHKVWTLRGTFPRDLWNVFLIVIQCYPFATGYCSTLIHSTHHLLCSIMFNDSHQRIPETHRILGSAKHAKHPVFGEGCSIYSGSVSAETCTWPEHGMTWHDPRVTKAVLHSPAKFPKRFRTQIARKKALTKSKGIPLVIYELMNFFHVLYNCRDLEHLRNCSQYSLLVLSRFPMASSWTIASSDFVRIPEPFHPYEPNIQRTALTIDLMMTSLHLMLKYGKHMVW